MLGFFRPKKTSDELKKFVMTAAEELQNGRYSYAEGLFITFFGVDRELQKTIAAALLTALSADGAVYPMEDAFHRYGYYYIQDVTETADIMSVPLERRKYPHLTDDEYHAILCCGTLYRNGYFREKALKMLPVSGRYMRYILLRVNDWVSEIRDTAADILCEILRGCDLYDIVLNVPAIERLCSGSRRSDAQMSRILEITDGRLKNELTSEDLMRVTGEKSNSFRNIFYRFGCKEVIFSGEQLALLIENEPLGNYKERLLIHKFGRYGCTDDEYERYIGDRCPDVRYQVMLRRYEDMHDAWDGLDAMLTDRSAKVRSLAVFILNKYRGFDPGSFYLELLKNGGNVAALADIGIYGTKEDAAEVQVYLSSEVPGIAKKALHSYGRLMGDDGEDVYRRFLFTGDMSMCIEAYRCITAAKIRIPPDELWEEYEKTGDAFRKKYLLYLICNDTSLQRLRYLIPLYSSLGVKDPVRGRVSASIQHRKMYTKISEKDGRELSELIENNRERLGRHLAEALLLDVAAAARN